MKSVNRSRWMWIAGATAMALAIPVLGQDKPESILPPGFGDPVETAAPVKEPSAQPSSGSSGAPSSGSSTPSTPRLSLDPSSFSDSGGSSGEGTKEGEAGEEGEEGELAAPALQDLPPQARRSVDIVGVLQDGEGGMATTAFGNARGPYLSHLIKSIDAPIASRWASITLRRALLSEVNSPAGLDPADWVADRAWLLLRMGEADAARMLVQRVDADRYSPWLKDIALQSALATADPGAMCPMVDYVDTSPKQAEWALARAMCMALSGEPAQAGALVDLVRDRGAARGMDVLLAEKIVGAGGNSRRAINILWENVEKLTAWRYGLATATAVAIPPKLMATAGPQVRAWRARAPLLPASDRLADADLAAAMGVFSNDALVDLYGQAMAETDPSEQSGKPYMALRDAYAGSSASAKVSAMRGLWDQAAQDGQARYARWVLTARAASMLPPSDDLSADADGLVASMLSVGLDVQAARWMGIAPEGSMAWASLMVGAPKPPSQPGSSDVTGLDAGTTGKRNQFFFAGLAGLGRMDTNAANDVAEGFAIPIGRASKWTQALERAVTGREPGTVAVLAALGLQGKNWNQVSPAMLYHAVSALRRVGLEGEARMLAAEAVMRS